MPVGTRHLDQLPPELRELDKDHRVRWSVAAAAMLIAATDDAQRAAILAGGVKEFTRIARDKYRGQDFKDEDLRRVFFFIKYPQILHRTLSHGAARA